jgi:NAD(P)-dependent dehydrogenase (short-subunit alcohol dehydrogenase family)
MAFIAPDHGDTPLARMLDLGGRTVAVAGGASGIGAATARRLEEAGATVYLLDRSPDGDGPRRLSVDVTDEAAVAAAIEEIVAAEGGLHGWVHAAGTMPRGALLDLTTDEWRQLIDLNLTATALSTRLAGQAIADAGGGTLVTIASTVAYRVNHNAAHYRATKAAVLALTQSLAVELAPLGVRALAVCPTLTLTEGVKRLREENPGAGLDRYGARLPLGRAAVPDDIARAIVFALSDLSSFMTGSALLVDGGELAR